MGKELRLYISGHSLAIDFDTLETISPKNRKIGGRNLDTVVQIISHVINKVEASEVKISLKSCETGITPNHDLYSQIDTVENKYHEKGTGMISQVKISLSEKVDSNESTVEYVARELKLLGHSQIVISGLNGVLLTKKGKTEAVVSRDIYSKGLGVKCREQIMYRLTKAIEVSDLNSINDSDGKNLMHIRKVKVQI